MAMSMQQIASLLCDAPPRLNIKSRKRRQAPAQPEQSDLEQRLSCIPGALASRFLGGISLCQVSRSCCPLRPYQHRCTAAPWTVLAQTHGLLQAAEPTAASFGPKRVSAMRGLHQMNFSLSCKTPLRLKLPRGSTPGRSATQSSDMHIQCRDSAVVWAARRRRQAARRRGCLALSCREFGRSSGHDLIRDGRGQCLAQQAMRPRLPTACCCNSIVIVGWLPQQVWTLCHEGSGAQSTNTGVFRTQRIGAALYDPTLAKFRQDW